MASLAEKIKSDPLASIRNVTDDKLTSFREITGKWLNIEPNRLTFGTGGHQIFSAIIQAFTTQEDVVACEEITYNGWLEACQFLHRKVVSIKMDKEGMIPEALDEAAGKCRIWGLFLMPSLHNPLNIVMPLERRRAIVEVCRKHGLWVIDDDAYRFLNPSPPPSFAHLYAERSFWIQSFTKSLFPAIKTAVVAAPVSALPALDSALRYRSPGLTLPWVIDLIQSGKFDEVIHQKREEARKRQAIARDILNKFTYQMFATSFHLWVPLSQEAEVPGVNVMSGKKYWAGPGPSNPAVRLTLAGENDPIRMKEGLSLISQKLRQ